MFPAARPPFIRARQAALILCALPFLILAACDPPSQAAIQCGELSGRWESRNLPHDESRAAVYCVFPDGSECFGWQFYDGTCAPPGADAPLSPLAIPQVEQAESSLTEVIPSMAIHRIPPQSLGDLIVHAPLIVIGEIGEVIRYTETVQYDENGHPLLFANGRPYPGTPVTDFQLDVEEVVRDDGTVGSGEPVVLRMSGHITEAFTQRVYAPEYPVSYTGDRHLFLLSPYPDGETYGFYYGPWSRLIIDGDSLRVSNGNRDPLVFDATAGPVTLDAFKRALEDE